MPITDTEFKARWVAALRSGEFEQGNGRLMQRFADPKRYCCLGVACVLQGVDLDAPGLMLRTDWNLDGRDLGDIVPGLSEIDCNMLAGMNDSGKSFPEIATYIKEKL